MSIHYQAAADSMTLANVSRPPRNRSVISAPLSMMRIGVQSGPPAIVTAEPLPRHQASLPSPPHRRRPPRLSRADGTPHRPPVTTASHTPRNKRKLPAMFDTIITALYVLVALAMVLQYLWITKPRSENSRTRSTNEHRYGLIDVSWIRDCRSNARNVLVTTIVFVLFVLGNFFYLVHLASGHIDSTLYAIASRDPIIVPIIIAFIVAVYQVLLGEIFFINIVKKIKGTDMWILWIFFLIVISILPSVVSSTDPNEHGSGDFYDTLAKDLGQFWFLGMMATAVTIMYVLWVYHALFVQLSVNDGFSLPQFVKNIRINILESIARPRVLIQTVVIGPTKSGKSVLSRRMADRLHIYEKEEKKRLQTPRPKSRAPDARPHIPPGTTETPLPSSPDGPTLDEPHSAATNTSLSEHAIADTGDRVDGNTPGAAIAGAEKIEFRYRDIKTVSPLTRRGRPRSVQLCHYMLDCAGELLGDHIFLPVSVRVDVLIVLIRANALNKNSEKVLQKQYWTLRSIKDLWAQDHHQGLRTMEYFQGIYAATRSDDRDFSFHAQYRPKSVVVVLNVDDEDSADLLQQEELLLDMLKALAKDMGAAFNIQSPMTAAVTQLF